MAEYRLPKPTTRVRFPSPAPTEQIRKVNRLFFLFTMRLILAVQWNYFVMILLSQWYYRKFCLKATKSFSSKTDDNSNKEVQNFNFASAIAQILNLLQNSLPIVYIFAHAKIKVVFYIFIYWTQWAIVKAK